ncbi:thiamine phosphate synthase [Qipengyuania gelatinilytica]|uniref:thiamine phosphate synthase n=1 Tax=Qipengyuania gelatinilytica TaxID=2867231 RepID=UPI001FFC54FE|nr:thiamine phosphate synthase [Qipengyuania gelatinilytica]
MSDARNDTGLAETLRALPRGSGFVFRHYHLEPAQRRARFDELAGIARSCGHKVILSGEEDWGADGSYGPPERSGKGLKLVTAHDSAEIEKAVAAQADGIFLSPVFPTASHPGAATLGVHGFHELARQSPVPVIALGGMNAQRALELDWPRWGAIDGLGSTNMP